MKAGVFGLIAFVVQKRIIASAFCAPVLLINLVTRNTAVGIIAGFLVATGGLAMGFTLFGEMLGVSWLQLGGTSNFLISGATQKIALTFDGRVFVQVLLVSAVWLAGCTFLSRRALLRNV